MKDLPLNALRVFAMVCRDGGVRAAARELGVAHSSVSRHLAELEMWLGVPIRQQSANGRDWSPTAQGQALGRVVLAALQDIDSATTALREVRSQFTVVLSTTPSFAARWLLPRLPRLERSHPRIELSVRVSQQLEELSAGGVDVAIRMGAGPWPGLHCEPLMDDALCPVASRGYWEAHGRGITMAALGSLRLLHDRDPQASWDIWRRHVGPVDLDLRRGPRLASSDLLLRAAAQGQGVALARMRLCADELAAGALIRPFGNREVRVPRAYWLVRRDAGPPRFALRTVLGWLKAEANHPMTRNALITG